MLPKGAEVAAISVGLVSGVSVMPGKPSDVEGIGLGGWPGGWPSAEVLDMVMLANGLLTLMEDSVQDVDLDFTEVVSVVEHGLDLG